MKRRYSTVLAIGALCLFSCFRGRPALAVETALYVGKHFEVRGHDEPTKYVFNGDNRIARITGSLSTNARIQRFRLRSGWNLLSLAVSVTNLSEQLQRPGVINSARAWSPQTGNYSTVPQVAPAGRVLWVNASTNTSIAVVGTYTDPVNRQVSAGATYLASTGLEAWTPTLPSAVAAWSFDSQRSSFNLQPAWLARLTGDLAFINDLPNTFPPGQALYVINNAPFELEIPDPALRIRYYHQDHLGSSSVMTDATGALVEETAFYPFGIPRHEHRLRSIEEAYKFTQKERDRESGLYYFEARFLGGINGRFISVDPKFAALEAATPDPQKLNLYAYARNNPVLYVDPAGLDDFEVPEMAGSWDEFDAEATTKGMHFVLDNTWLGAALKAPPTPGLEDLANLAGGVGDSLLDMFNPYPRFMTGPFVEGPRTGPTIRWAAGINNVDMDSAPYVGGEVLTSLAVAGGGGSTVSRALGKGGEAVNVAKSVVDPLATTQAAPKMVSKGAHTVVSTAGGVSSIIADTVPGATAMYGGMTRNQIEWIQRVARSSGLAEAKMAAHAAGDQAALDRISGCWETLFRTAKFTQR